MRVLVTGAAGFVGSRVVRALADCHGDVHAVVRSDPGPRLRGVARIQLERCDLSNPEALAQLVARVRPELCIHCAWVATPGVYLTAPENETHTLIADTLARSLVEHGCARLVGIGTCFEYAPSDAPLSEQSPLAPTTAYARAKVAGFERMTELCSGSSTALAWARLFYLYGPGEDPRRLVPSVILSMLQGRPALTTLGEQRRDFLHVDDVAAALVAIARSQVKGAVNVGAGEAVPVRELVEKLGAITGRADLIQLGALESAPSDPKVVAADTRRLRFECGWTPELSLAEGLSLTAEWWAKHMDR
jgi:nucleoside-diphosphate-sugar epimerase